MSDIFKKLGRVAVKAAQKTVSQTTYVILYFFLDVGVFSLLSFQQRFEGHGEADLISEDTCFILVGYVCASNCSCSCSNCRSNWFAAQHS